MKTVTKKDFQNLYNSPGTKETEEMRQTLAHLSEKKSPERVPVIRRRRVAFILAVVMALMGVVAVATGFLNHTLVSWDAKPMVTEKPTTGYTDEESKALFELRRTGADTGFGRISPPGNAGSGWLGIQCGIYFKSAHSRREKRTHR